MSNLTLLDLVTLQGDDILTGLVEDVTTYAPELSQIPVVVRPGITYKVAQRTALPAAGFRLPNAGITGSKSAYKQTVKEMFPFDCPVVVDELIVQADDRTTGDVLSHEAQGALQSTVITLGNQIWYGTVGDGSNGFVGLRAQLVGTSSVGGSTNSSTAYAIWQNPWGVSLDIGKEGAIAMRPFERLYIPAPTGTGNIWAWCSNISFWIGLSVKSNYSVYGVCGITQHQSTVTSSMILPANPAGTIYDQAMTDRAMAQLVSQIPLNRRNGLVVYMNRTAHFLLQQSRAALNFQSAGAVSATPAWSPRPQDVEGFPIVVTDSIVNTESN